MALRARRGSSVEERGRYGDIARETIRHLATREAALVDAINGASDDPGWHEWSNRSEDGMRRHRPYVDRVEKMSRGVQGIDPGVGQDFDVEMEQLMQVVGTEIEWEMDVALPDRKGILGAADRQGDLRTLGHRR
jgi:hypothetical protein